MQYPASGKPKLQWLQAVDKFLNRILKLLSNACMAFIETVFYVILLQKSGLGKQTIANVPTAES